TEICGLLTREAGAAKPVLGNLQHPFRRRRPILEQVEKPSMDRRCRFARELLEYDRPTEGVEMGAEVLDLIPTGPDLVDELRQDRVGPPEMIDCLAMFVGGRRHASRYRGRQPCLRRYATRLLRLR